LENSAAWLSIAFIFFDEITAFLASKGYTKETGLGRHGVKMVKGENRIPVPVHSRNLSKHTAGKILSQAGFTPDDVMEGQTMSRKYTLSLVFYPQDDGRYGVTYPELRACFSEGNTIEEAETNIMDLIAELLPEQIGASNESREFFREGLGMKGKQFKFKEIKVEETGAGEIITALEESAEILTRKTG
jgi:predicted RNase H-like HicB family nuclease